MWNKLPLKIFLLDGSLVSCGSNNVLFQISQKMRIYSKVKSYSYTKIFSYYPSYIKNFDITKDHSIWYKIYFSEFDVPEGYHFFCHVWKLIIVISVT